MTYAVESDIGATKRQSGGVNEDSAGVVPLTLTVDGTDHTAEIVVVADGAGGHDAGEVASYLAVNRVVERLVEAVTTPTAHDLSSLEGRIDAPFRATPAEVEEAIEAAIEAANEDILSFCAEERTEAHTTVVAGVRIGGRLHYGWVGDSPIYLINRRHDRIERLTHDHSTVQEDIDAGAIDEVAALVHPHSNQLQRALGGSQYVNAENRTVDVETETVELFAEDVLLVASDGLVDAHAVGPRPDELFEAYRDAEAGSRREREVAADIREFAVTIDDIKSRVLDVADLNRAATALIEMANEYGGKDNVTVALLQSTALQSTPEQYPTRGWNADDISSQPTVVEERGTADSAAGEESDGAVEASQRRDRGATSAAESEPASDAKPKPESESEPRSDTQIGRDRRNRDDRETEAETRTEGGFWASLWRWLRR